MKYVYTLPRAAIGNAANRELAYFCRFLGENIYYVIYQIISKQTTAPNGHCIIYNISNSHLNPIFVIFIC